MTARSASLQWRSLLLGPADGAGNMARDSGLMDWARVTQQSVLTVYGWSRPTLSFGRNQLARNRYDRGAMRERGIDVVRRPTGGRALLHDREVTYSVAGVELDRESLDDRYHRVNSLIIAAFAALGVSATEAAGELPAPRPDTLPCFAVPTRGELVVGGRKLAGSAQVSENGAWLQHGSILIHDDQAILAELLTDDSPEPRPSAATLAELVGAKADALLIFNALVDAVAEFTGTLPQTLAAEELAPFTETHLARFRSDEWTWRR